MARTAAAKQEAKSADVVNMPTTTPAETPLAKFEREASMKAVRASEKELGALYWKMKEAKDVYEAAIRATATKAAMDKGVLKNYIAAKENDKVEQWGDRAYQYAIVFEA